MQSIKEKASNAAATAKSGVAKTKATVQEKVDKISASNDTEKKMASEKKEEKIHHAEASKQAAREQNAATKQAANAARSGHSV